MTKIIIISSFFILFGSLGFLNLETADAATRLNDTFNDSLKSTAEGTGHLSIGISNKSPLDVISFVIKTLLAFLGIVFLLLMIYGGFKWMLSAGNDQEIAQAKKIIKNGFIGLLIVVSSYAVTAFVGTLLSQATTQ